MCIFGAIFFFVTAIAICMIFKFITTIYLNKGDFWHIDGSNAADITVEVSVNNGSNYFAIASTVSVPADASIVVIGKDSSIYLDETDLLAVTASANSDLTYAVSYELIKDA